MAYQFTSSSDWINTNSSINLQPKDFTISFWIYLDSSELNQHIQIRCMNPSYRDSDLTINSSNVYYHIGVFHDGTITRYNYSINTNEIFMTTISEAKKYFVFNSWNNVILTVFQDNAYIYVNGNLVSASFIGFFGTFPNSSYHVIAISKQEKYRNPDGTLVSNTDPQTFKNKISDLGIWNIGVIPSSVINAISIGTPPTSLPGYYKDKLLVAYYKFQSNTEYPYYAYNSIDASTQETFNGGSIVNTSNDPVNGKIRLLASNNLAFSQSIGNNDQTSISASSSLTLQDFAGISFNSRVPLYDRVISADGPVCWIKFDYLKQNNITEYFSDYSNHNNIADVGTIYDNLPVLYDTPLTTGSNYSSIFVGANSGIINWNTPSIPSGWTSEIWFNTTYDGPLVATNQGDVIVSIVSGYLYGSTVTKGIYNPLSSFVVNDGNAHQFIAKLYKDPVSSAFPWSVWLDGTLMASGQEPAGGNPYFIGWGNESVTSGSSISYIEPISTISGNGSFYTIDSSSNVNTISEWEAVSRGVYFPSSVDGANPKGLGGNGTIELGFDVPASTIINPEIWMYLTSAGFPDSKASLNINGQWTTCQLLDNGAGDDLGWVGLVASGTWNNTGTIGANISFNGGDADTNVLELYLKINSATTAISGAKQIYLGYIDNNILSVKSFRTPSNSGLYSQQYYTGIIDDFSFYNYALSDSQIRTHWASGHYIKSTVSNGNYPSYITLSTNGIPNTLNSSKLTLFSTGVMPNLASSGCHLYIRTTEAKSVPLYLYANDVYGNRIPLYIKGNTSSSNHIPLYIHSVYSDLSSVNLFLDAGRIHNSFGTLGLYSNGIASGSHQTKGQISLYLTADYMKASMPIYISASRAPAVDINSNLNLYIAGHGIGCNNSLSLIINPETQFSTKYLSNNTKLYIRGSGISNGTIPLYSNMGLYIMNTEKVCSSGIGLYSKGFGSINSNISLYMASVSGTNNNSISLYTRGLDNASSSLRLYSRGY